MGGSRWVVLREVRALDLSDSLWLGPALTGGVVIWFVTGFRTSPSEVRSGMAVLIEDHFMTAEYDGRVIATARYSADAAADGHGA